MTNKVVHSLYKVFRDEGFAALRFNFRGVGGSQGSHDGGTGEQHDVRAASRELERRVRTAARAPGPFSRVLGGFSFGSIVGLTTAATDPEITHRVAVGLPLGLGAADGRDYDWTFLEEDPRPLFLVVGEEDEFCPTDELEARVHALRAVAVPVSAVVVPGADHFFNRLGHVLRQELSRVAATISGRVPDPRRHPVREL
jgi:alpha/beta superfamily hydrolase